jgi:hypothetical protein
MSQIEDGMTTEETAMVEHVAEAWHVVLALPAEEQWTVIQFFAGCFDWSEVEADVTNQWRATLPPSDRTTGISMTAMDRMWLIAGIMTGYDTLDDDRKHQFAEYADRLVAEHRTEQRAAKGRATRCPCRWWPPTVG